MTIPKYHRIKLGQHLLASEKIAKDFVDSASLRDTDLVFEIGTGYGIVTKYVAPLVRKVVSCDVQRDFIDSSKANLSQFPNIDFVLGDAFGPSLRDIEFDVCVTSLPYSRSRDFLQWLFARAGNFRSASAIMQEEFVSKLFALPGQENYRAISVLAQIAFDMKTLFPVSRDEFDPPPRVFSRALNIFPRKSFQGPAVERRRQISLVNQIFSFRGRLFAAATRGIPKLKRVEIPLELKSKRVEQISPHEYGRILEFVAGEPT